MIISHKHKFIFLHIPKTAGSSMAVYLSRFFGDDDIMMDAWNDALHHGIPYNKRVYKEALSQRGKLYLEEALRKRMEDGKIFDRPVVDYAFRKKIAEHLGTDSMHATAGHLSRYVPEEWNSYFKFAFMRNPYSQAVSLYNWRVMQVSGRDHLISKEWVDQSEPVIPFREFLLRILDVTRPDPEGFVSVDNRFKYSGWNIVSIDNKIEVLFAP